MMNESEYRKWTETAWRRPLTAAEEAALREQLLGDPQRLVAWEEEQALNGALRRIPRVPVSSNFTAQVLAAVAQEERREARAAAAPFWARIWPRFGPRLAWGAALVVVGASSLWHFQAASQRELVDSLSTAMAALPAPEVLQDFDDINRLSQVATVSDEVLLEFLR